MSILFIKFFYIFFKNFFPNNKKALPAVKLVGFACIKKQIGLSIYIFSDFPIRFIYLNVPQASPKRLPF
nr:MAG TPA: hypothetical protein [Caudoviricetes sp.]